MARYLGVEYAHDEGVLMALDFDPNSISSPHFEVYPAGEADLDHWKAAIAHVKQARNQGTTEQEGEK